MRSILDKKIAKVKKNPWWIAYSYLVSSTILQPVLQGI